MFVQNACFNAIYIVKQASVVTGQTLKAGSSVILHLTRSYHTSLERSYEFLNDEKMFKGIAIILYPFRQGGKQVIS